MLKSLNDVIIFEGHDRSLKTTIANALAKKFDTEVFMTNSKECFTNGIRSGNSGNLANFNYCIAKYAYDLKRNNMLDKPIIIYRSFLSEMVYAKLLSRQTSDTINMLTDAVFKAAGATIILCKNETLETYKDRILTDHAVKRSIGIYNELKGKVQCDILEIDTSGYNVNDYVDQIINYLLNKRSLV